MAKLRLFDRVVGVLAPRALLERGLKLSERGGVVAAFPLFVRAADAGLTEAQYQVGKAYLEAAGVPFSRGEAARWLLRAAESGLVPAQALLASLFLSGHTQVDAQQADDLRKRGLFDDGKAVPDFDAALHWARRSAEGGSAEGNSVVGFVLSSGPERLRDLPESDAAFRRAAEGGSPQGALGLGLALIRGEVSPADAIEAVKWFAQAADAGLPTAQYLLGVMNQRGIGLDRNLETAAELFKRAAERGLRSAQARYGYALLSGLGVRPNETEGESWLRRAALAGDHEAAALVGRPLHETERWPATQLRRGLAVAAPRRRRRPQPSRAVARPHVSDRRRRAARRRPGRHLVPHLGRGGRDLRQDRPREPRAARRSRPRERRAHPRVVRGGCRCRRSGGRVQLRPVPRRRGRCRQKTSARHWCGCAAPPMA